MKGDPGRFDPAAREKYRANYGQINWKSKVDGPIFQTAKECWSCGDFVFPEDKTCPACGAAREEPNLPSGGVEEKDTRHWG